MFRAPTLVLALLVSAPALWSAFATQSTSVSSFLLHYLVAVVIVRVLMGLLGHAVRKPVRLPNADGDKPKDGRGP